MARIKFLNFTPRPKPRKRPRRHKKRPNKSEKKMQKNIIDKGDNGNTRRSTITKRCTRHLLRQSKQVVQKLYH